MKKTTSTEQQESRRAMIKLAIEVAGPVLTAATIIIGIWQFNSQRAEDTKKEIESRAYAEDLDFRRRYWERQQETYVTICELTGTIISGDGEPLNDTAVRQLRKLYYGKAAFVEDKEVAAAMRSFSESIEDYKTGFLDEAGLKKKGFRLIEACKNSSKKTWESLSPLFGK